MLARHDGQVVFVAGAIPGERVRVRVERVARQTAFRRGDRRFSSPARIAAAASIDWACGGSLYAHIAYRAAAVAEVGTRRRCVRAHRKDRVAGAVPVWRSTEHGYRMRARLHARDGRFGFLSRRHARVVRAAPTGQLLPATIDALEQLRHTLQAANVPASASCEISRTCRRPNGRCSSSWGRRSRRRSISSRSTGMTGLLFARSIECARLPRLWLSVCDRQD